MPQEDGTIVIENAHIFFLNFSGKEGMYNAEGDRNFCLELEPAMARDLERDGWNVKYTKVREDGDEPIPYIQVSIKYTGRNGVKVRPPVLVLVTSKNRMPLGEDECEILDWVDIGNVDIIVRPYTWSVSGKTGVKAYLKAIYVTARENALESKYAHLPEVRMGQSALAIEAPQEEIWEGEVIEEDQLAIGA